MAQVIYKYKGGSKTKKASGKTSDESSSQKSTTKTDLKIQQAAVELPILVANPIWSVAHDYEVLISGNRYDARNLKNLVINSRDYLQFKLGLGLSSQELNLLDNWTSAYLDGLTSGTMYIEDNKIVDNANIRKNNGVYNKEAKTADELNNNASLLATAYILDRFKVTAPFNKVAARQEYKFNIENALAQDYASKEFDLGAFELLDAEDAKTGKRGIKNRLLRLADAFEREGVKIYEQIDYRDVFNWRGNDFNENQKNAKAVADNLLAIAKGLRDGKVDPEDKRLMGETGLGIDFIDAFINEETEKSRELARKAAEEAAKKEGDNKDDDGDAGTYDGTDDKDPVVTTVPEGTKDGYYFRYPWSSPVYVKKGLIVQDPDSDPETKQAALNARSLWMLVYSIKPDDYLLEAVRNLGYNYVADITNAFNHAKGVKVHAYSTKFGGASAFTVYDTKGDNDPLNDVAYTGTKLVLGNDGQWRLLTKNSAGEAAYKVIGTYNQNSAKDAFVRHYINESFDQGNYDRTTIKNYMTLMAQNAKVTAHLNLKFSIKDIIKGLLKTGHVTIYNVNKDKYSSSFDQGDNYIVPIDAANNPVTNAGVLLVRMNDRGKFRINNPSYSSDSYFNTDFNNINGVGWYESIQVNKQGGVLKAFSGLQFKSLEEINTDVNNRKQATYTEANLYWEQQHIPRTPSASFNGFENSKQEALSGIELTGTDYARLSGSLADVVSAAGGFIPGLHIASTAVGLASSVTEFVSDIIDLASGREGSLGFFSSLGEFALNAGMDAVSLLPAGKAAKLTKGLTTIATYAPMIAGAIQTGLIVSDPNEIKSLQNTWDKVTNYEFSSLGTKDYYNIAYVLRTVLGLNNATRLFISKPEKTGTRTITGTVKTADGDKDIQVSVNSSKFKTFSTNQKMAKLALAAEANKLSNTYKKQLDSKNNKNNNKNNKNKNKKGEKSKSKPKFTEDDVTVSTGLFGKVKSTVDRKEVETWEPKRIFENFFGLGNEGIHTFSDKQIMSKWEKKGSWPISKERLDEIEKDKKERPFKYTESTQSKLKKKKELRTSSEESESNSRPLESSESDSKVSDKVKDLIKSAREKGKQLVQVGKSAVNNTVKNMPESINNKVGKAKRWVNKISQQVSKSLSKNTKPQNSLNSSSPDKQLIKLVMKHLKKSDPNRFGSMSEKDMMPHILKWILKNKGKLKNLNGKMVTINKTGGLIQKFNNGKDILLNETATDTPVPDINWADYGKNGFTLDVLNTFKTWLQANPNNQINDFVTFYNGQIDVLNNTTAKPEDKLKAFKTIYGSLNINDDVTKVAVNTHSSGLDDDQRTIILGDNYGSVTVGSDGKLKHNKGNSFGTRLFKTIASEVKPNLGTALNLVGLALSNKGTDGLIDILKEIRPTLTSTYLKKYLEKGDIMPYLLSIRDAGTVNTLASIPFTSKMETAIGAKLKAYSTNSDIIQKGIIHNSDKYAASQKEALTAINDNLKNEIDNANENAKAINAVDTNNILNRAKAYATKYENRRKFVNGLSEEMKKYNVMEYYYDKQKAAADLAYEQELDLLRYDLEYIQKIKNSSQYKELKTRYEAENEGKLIENLPDDELMELFFKTYSSARLEYLRGRNEKEHYYNLKIMELASRYLPRPGWNVTQPAKQTDLITGRVSYNKSGGKLTDQEKRKLKALKEFNKASERDVKQFYKNSKESSRQFAKNINNLSKESKMLLKAALLL